MGNTAYKNLVSFILAVQIIFNPILLLASEQKPNFDLHPEERAPIRMSYSAEQCLTFYCPEDYDPQTGKIIINESVGIPIANGTPEDFESAIQHYLKGSDKEKLKGIIYVAGVDVKSEKKVLSHHQEILVKYGLQEQLQVKVLSMPKEKVITSAMQLAKAFLQRTLYWFPSIKRDYEAPHSKEVLAALASTAVIEAGTVYYLFDTLPTTDALLTLTFHSIVLASYAIYTKSMVNWLLRPGSTKVEGFLKQVSLSLPFVLNYNIFGQFTPIVEYLKTHTVAETMSAFPNEVIEFASTQSVTMLLQTLFYYVVITKVVGQWTNLQNGVQRSAEARVFRKIAETPILAVNAVFLAIASGTGSYELAQIGSMEINSGHAMLVLLTLLGGMTYKVGLTPAFEMYSWVKKRITPKVLDYFQESLGIDLRYATATVKTSCQSALDFFKN